MLRLKALQFPKEVAPQLRNLSFQFVHLFENFDRNGTGQRSSTERGSMQSRLHCRSNAICCQQRTQRQSCRERLRDRDDVRSNPVLLIGKIFSCPPESTLDFIQEKQSIRFLGQFAGSLQEFLAYEIDASLTLDGFNANGTHAAVELPLKILDVIESDEVNSGNKRHKGIAILCLAGS